jgi:hypothetical protein
MIIRNSGYYFLDPRNSQTQKCEYSHCFVYLYGVPVQQALIVNISAMLLGPML